MKNKDDLAYLLDIDVNGLDKYKLHAAVNNGSVHPLDVYIKDGKDAGKDGSSWHGWQTYSGGTDRWKGSKYILSFMQMYPEGKTTWLFGGIFEITEGIEKGNPDSYYGIKLTDRGEEYIGRLKINYSRGINSYQLLKPCYEELKLSEILKVPYYQLGKPFNGYENISLDFTELESIIEISREDWRRTLYHIKGVYVIFDKHTGKKYVGSAYGEGGIWNRWCCYVDSLHGNNKELKELFSENEKDMLEIFADSSDYARSNFRFTLIEYWPSKTDDKEIKDREKFWKEALLSRGEFGYNAN